MTTILAIDPGHAGEGNACAWFVRGEFVHAQFERFTGGELYMREPVDIVVVERPTLQGERTRAANPGDLMNLSWSGAMIAGAYAGRDGARLVTPTPQEWKGAEPKPIHHKRLWAVLAEHERDRIGGDATYRAIGAACRKGALKRWGIAGAACYPRTFTAHNLLDACALGCHYLGRLRKTG